MPISRDEWNKGRVDKTTQSAVERFLRNNPKRAFTDVEIAEGLYGFWGVEGPRLRYLWKKNVVLASVREALQELLIEGRIKVKDVNKEDGTEAYYVG